MKLSLVLSALAYIVVLATALPMQAAIAKRACKRADLLPNVEKREDFDPEPYQNDYNESTYGPCG
ncbi:uncharacterized protein F5891DRAFT_1192716 [Suillus fuscotomentosus]|uniref:Uncharacterized protein n=1 Tax=Suillus fuscotomentosus TaxID=1912939 RepID=A0AAD4E015_9AGAM|nr:uncharacterized protein F5891DRAFT_1192716 [Suillus fuscotomentosus]KAG1896822.1 hypothetical protein F5891DRAFT_1192716 [Suillus fuscotomentosus]